MKRYYIIVEGLVQGVGFRWFVQTCANKYGLTGSVKNLDNGMVEVYAQGNEDALTSLIHDLERGSHYSHVENVYYKSCPLKEKERSFQVEYY